MRLYFAIAIFLGMLLASCSGNNSDGLDGEVKIDGSSTVFPITEAVAEEFRSEAPNVRVTVGVSGTGGGFQKFIRGETDINNASREIKPSEIAEAEEAGVDYVRLSVAYDGLAVVVNPENDWVDHFTVEELKEIWEPTAQGNITRWNQIRDGWPDEEFHLYGPGVASGTYDYFTEAIVGESGSSRGDFTASEDDNVLVQGIATDKYAIGFFGLAYFEENADRLKLLGVKDGEGEPVEPSLETVSNNTYTPLSRPLFIYISESAAQKKQVQEFVNFYLNNAPELSKDIGYVPMPDSAYQRQKNKFQEFVGADSTATSEN
ncbi:PstS family phosphate ABC transporter substrate-binding protein [Balneolaceae bacterium YR4-1]|uniref:Phosphate-binding protein n=1 Tax=Halalkalibaculum roseum TaxID=2709311 RepID=A0A6M1T2C7_9BACT|nr:PstS family phosphate ABC transporter substrate-binding protein [Halalkalibaculum roseum]NGP76917.1 PstS family phosphate ABC transporter substrate-binding protein [Halalkalibaculum roseum]